MFFSGKNLADGKKEAAAAELGQETTFFGWLASSGGSKNLTDVVDVSGRDSFYLYKLSNYVTCLQRIRIPNF